MTTRLKVGSTAHLQVPLAPHVDDAGDGLIAAANAIKIRLCRLAGAQVAAGLYNRVAGQVTGTLSIRPHRCWLINVGADYNEISLAEGRFTTRVWTNDVNTQLNPFESLVNRLQFDTVTRQLGWQSRFRWITKPGNDIFFVYTHNWTDRTRLQTLDRKGSIRPDRTLTVSAPRALSHAG